MILSFHIEYRTNWGEEVRILGSVPELGSWEEEQAVPLQTVDGISWSLSKEIQHPANEVVKYTYYIYKDGKPVRKEWDSFLRKIHINSNGNIVFRSLDS